MLRERFRYDKDAEVSACTERMPDTCAFVPTPHKVIPMQGGNSEKASHQDAKAKRLPQSNGNSV